MYEDDPQEKVFDVLGEAVFGDHPLGRAIIGRAPVIADTPVAAIAGFHGARYVPANIVIAAAGAVDHDALVELAAERVDARARPHATARRPALGAPRRSARRAAFERKDTEQYHVCLGGPGLSRHDDRRFALRRARHDLRRHLVVAPVPGGARAARARLLGLLVHERLHGHRPGRPVRRHPRRQRRRGAGGRRHRARAPARASRPPPRSSSAPRRTSRAGSCCRSSRPARG